MTEAGYAKSDRLLAAHEPPVVEVLNPAGTSPYFFTCEHAGNRLPEKLGSLGLPDKELSRHIAWDIGAAGIVRHLAAELDATCVLQPYSRLVVDCNRHTSSVDYLTTLSEATPVPGNIDLTPQARAARSNEIYWPYQNTIKQLLDARDAARRPTIVLPIHTFTDVFHAQRRPWHIGVLYGDDKRFARLLLELFGTHSELVLGDNEPYRVEPNKDYTLPVHGEKRGYLTAAFEIRQDLVIDGPGQKQWAGVLHRQLEQALREVQRMDLTNG